MRCSSRPSCMLLPLQPQKKSISCCAPPHLRQGPAYPGQNPKERNCKPKRAVIHRRFKSEDHSACPRARLLQTVLARAALGTSASCCPRTSVDVVQRQACSLILSSSPVLPLLPFPPLSPLSFSLPKALVQVVQDEGDKAWEGVRPTSRVPVRNEGTGVHRLSNLSCLAFPVTECLMAISA